MNDQQQPDPIAGRRSSKQKQSLEGEEYMSQSSPSEIDVRSLVPAQRHRKIFELINELAIGGTFVLVNDHDPKPLYYQLEAEYPHQFSWTYLERGPEVWRIEIGRQRKAA
jgi:uncharacterized protein (DUF2249 family)